MGMKKLLTFEPVRTLSATLAFGAALIVGAAYNQQWSGEAVGLISGAWSAFIALVGTFFTRNQVTPNASVDQAIQDALPGAIIDLAKAFPNGAPKL